MKKSSNTGFTMIELAILLVIIGLLVGGTLAGKDLIRAAEIRAQISQIERFNTAVNTFREKYDALPGDIPPSMVTAYGFRTVPVRAGTIAQGDGNGILEGYDFPGTVVLGFVTSGETAWFWEDLSSNSSLIDGTFNTATGTDVSAGVGSGAIGPTSLIPEAKIGGGNFVYVYSSNGTNYYGISFVSQIDAAGAVYGTSSGENPGLTVSQAYALDKKVDDGLPQTGNVQAQYQNWYLNGSYSGNAIWAASGYAGASGTAATAGSPTTCYDNSAASTGSPGVSGALQHYSMDINNGSGKNCGLSFRFQ